MTIPSFARSKLLIFWICTLSLCTSSPGALVDFEITPAGLLNGAPGQTVGWGYTLANNSLDQWLIPTAAFFDPFLYGTPGLLFDFPVLSPGAMVSVNFDPSAAAGLFAVEIAPDAPSGFVEQGTFTILADWWTDDPMFGGMPIGPSEDLSQPWQLEIAENVPEPSTKMYLVPVLGALWWAQRNRRLFYGGKEE